VGNIKEGPSQIDNAPKTKLMIKKLKIALIALAVLALILLIIVIAVGAKKHKGGDTINIFTNSSTNN
jgi:hypothetical protein